ncbi:hypothetical protein ACWIID_43385 [Streptomyces phaeochromogenes]
MAEQGGPDACLRQENRLLGLGAVAVARVTVARQFGAFVALKPRPDLPNLYGGVASPAPTPTAG